MLYSLIPLVMTQETRLISTGVLKGLSMIITETVLEIAKFSLHHQINHIIPNPTVLIASTNSNRGTTLFLFQKKGYSSLTKTYHVDAGNTYFPEIPRS